MMPVRALALAFAAALAGVSSNLAQAADTATLGGPGGQPFRSECPAGQYLTGFEVKAATVIETLTPLCAAVEGSKLGAGLAQASVGGDSGAGPRKALCGTNTYVSGLKVARTDNMIVSSIQVSCRSVETSALVEATCVGASQSCRGRSVECGEGEAAVGIIGSAGKSLNALGLVCGPRPGMTAAPIVVADAAPAATAADVVPAADPPKADAAAEAAPTATTSDVVPAADSPKADAAPAAVTPVLLAATKPGETFRSCPGCPEMVIVPAGEFVMGSPEGEDGRDASESPQRTVTIPRPFAIGRTEVTFGEWDLCVADGLCPLLDDKGWGRADRPVINVGYEQALSYIVWLSLKSGHSYRLPSEAEWEYAARAGSQSRWSFGDDAAALAEYGVYSSTGVIEGNGPHTQPVAKLKPNAFGLYDVHGNVYEMVEDLFRPSYAGPPTDGTVWAAATTRVLRGGAWNSSADMLRSAHRRTYPEAQDWIGFRLAMTIEETPPAPAPDQKAEATPEAAGEAQAEAAAAAPPPTAGEAAPVNDATEGAGAPAAMAEAPPPAADMDDVAESAASPDAASMPPPAAPMAAARAPQTWAAPPPPAPVAAARAPAAPVPAPMAAPMAARKVEAEKPDEKFSLVPVFYGTDRKPLGEVERVSFGSDRGRKLELGRALVSVPTEHQVPNVERPWAVTIPGTNIKIYEEKEDPAKHFTMREIKSLSREQFLALVKDRLKSSKGYKDQAFVFIHGYNTTFDNAVYRTAQIAHDLDFDGVPFLYSWPSRGELASYTYDRASNEQAEPFMREFVELIAKKSGAKQVSVIAHSMGNQLTLRVLRELKSAKIVVNQIILAAPDVDRDSFENIARELKGLSKGITLYAAANDRALLASQRFHGGVPRAGDVPSMGPVVIDGVSTIDVTTLSTDSLGLNHSTYAERTALLDDIGRLLKTGEKRPDKRTPTLARVPFGKLEYWKFPPN